MAFFKGAAGFRVLRTGHDLNGSGLRVFLVLELRNAKQADK